MLNKTKITEKIKAIAKSGNHVDAEIAAYVKKTFHAAHLSCDKTGASLKQETKTLLSGVEAGLKAAGYKSKNLIGKSAKIIAEDTNKAATASVAAAHNTADKAKLALVKATKNLAKSTVETVDKKEADARQAMTTAYAELQKKTDIAERHLADVAMGIKEYSKSKTSTLKHSTRASLMKAEHKAQRDLLKLQQKSVQHCHDLMHHSKEKLSAWLHDTKTRIGHLHHKS